jgi:hypothetical protein
MIASLGEEKRCPRCREIWPLTPEFFRRIVNKRWQSYCRACEAEWVAEKRRKPKGPCTAGEAPP